MTLENKARFRKLYLAAAKMAFQRKLSFGRYRPRRADIHPSFPGPPKPSPPIPMLLSQSCFEREFLLHLPPANPWGKRIRSLPADQALMKGVQGH
jgi:hypothetical protein